VTVARVSTIVTTLQETTNATVTKDTSYTVQTDISVSVSKNKLFYFINLKS